MKEISRLYSINRGKNRYRIISINEKYFIVDFSSNKLAYCLLGFGVILPRKAYHVEEILISKYIVNSDDKLPHSFIFYYCIASISADIIFNSIMPYTMLNLSRQITSTVLLLIPMFMIIWQVS